MAQVAVEKWRRTRNLYYLGGLHSKSQKTITVVTGQTTFTIKAEVGTLIEVPDWAARDLIQRYTHQGHPCFTTNAKLAQTVKNGRPTQAAVQQVELTDDEIKKRYAAIMASEASASSKKKKKSEEIESEYADQLAELESDLEKEMS